MRALLLLLAGLWAALPAGAAPLCAPDRVSFETGEGRVAFEVEIADEPGEQTRGLMFRPRLPEDEGMLFVYDAPREASFWMKNTMIPLDMIFIDDAGRVVNIAARTVPYSLEPRRSEGPVRAVLEINGGLAEALGIVPGAQAIHPAFRAAPEGVRCPPAGGS
jgi:hypothetical protein